MNRKGPKQIAPRLAGGLSRDNWGGRLPPDIKEAIKTHAKRENKSVSWMFEQVIIDYFNLLRPRYDPRYLHQAKELKLVVSNKKKKRHAS